MQKKEVRSIDLDIQEKFKVIDQYLPKSYTSLVIQKLPNVTPNAIRVTRNARKGNIAIIKALLEVAEESKF